MALRIDDEFAVFLGKRSLLRQRQNIENRFRRAAELHPPGRHDDRPIDENGVREHVI